jgi:hypothetical protein
MRLMLCSSFIWLALSLSACSDDDDELPAVIAAAACASVGGQVAAMCPAGTEPITAVVERQRHCCTPQGSISFDQCREIGGEVHTDPGDGSLEGCPFGATTISSRIDGAIEGGFCCRS